MMKFIRHEGSEQWTWHTETYNTIKKNKRNSREKYLAASRYDTRTSFSHELTRTSFSYEFIVRVSWTLQYKLIADYVAKAATH